MTATDELRRMLDERGVEWMGTSYKKPTQGHPTYTSLGEEYSNAEFIEYFDGNVLRLFDITTEQAIEATLGRETCHRALDFDGTRYVCSACGENFGPSRWHFCPNCGRKVVDDASVD